MNYGKARFKKAFTIVELTVVIVIIGLIAAIAIISYSSWRENIAESAVKTELEAVRSAMNDAKNFSNGYPSALPNAFVPSDHVTTNYAYGDTTSYCVNAMSVNYPSIKWKLEVNGKEFEISEGECSSGSGNWKYVAVSNDATCAVTTANTIYCWGNGLSSSPSEIGMGTIPSGATITGLTAGSGHFCAVANNWGYCWGDNTNGRLGNGSSTASMTPVTVSAGQIPGGVLIQSISAGGNHTCALASNGLGYCWGYGANGQLGRNSTSSSTTPVSIVLGTIPGGVTGIALDAGGSNACALATNGWVYCWGSGSSGELGNAGTSQSNSPVTVAQGAIPAGQSIQSISVGGNHSCARANNISYCWGSGVNGRIGDGVTSNRTSPTLVNQTNMTSADDISAGGSFSCALSSGDAYCWGNNADGQLGIGSTSTYYIPIAAQTGQKPSAADYTSIYTGQSHACGITTSGQLYCWGLGTSGQLGDGGTSSSTTPRLVTISNP